MNSKEPIQLIRCPHCKKQTAYSPSNKFRPFCSERCQLIDLGDWADEKFRVSEPLEDSEDGYGHKNEEKDTDS